MALYKNRVPENVEGACFVDSSCIDCDACRFIAPDIFGQGDGHSYVRKMPSSTEEFLSFQRALLSCPVNAIGDKERRPLKEAMDSLPCLLDNDVYYCGFTARESYGAQSYFIKSLDGNWLIDSPTFNPYLRDSFKENGGIKFIFLSHQDDVADAFQYAEYFNSTIIAHEFDFPKLKGSKNVVLLKNFENEIISDCIIIPTPGHTRGSMCLLYKNKFLFTGDHLHFSIPNGEDLDLFAEYCWFDFDEQVISANKLAQFSDVEWILPGHGYKGKVSKGYFPNAISTAVKKYTNKELKNTEEE